MRVVFMGTPQFAVPSLEAVVEAGHDVVLVVTQPDRPAGRGRRLQPPPVKEAALARRLEVIQPANVQDSAFHAKLESLQPDAVCVVAFGAMLPSRILNLGRFGCINVHPSLLPEYRGAAPIQRAIMDGRTETGVSTMFLTEEMDAGDIILQQRVPIEPDDDSGSLHDRLAEIGARLLVDTLTALEQGIAPRIPQDHAAATYAPKIGPEDEQLNWHLSAFQLHNVIRGLRPRPGAYTYFRGKRLKIWRSRVGDGSAYEASPGEIVAVGKNAIHVQTGAGILLLTELQPENGRRQTAEAFCNGHRVQVGERMGCLDSKEVENV